jgi:cell division transport system ATP-binding protein
MIKFNNVSKVYADKSVALDGVSFGVKAGEFISVVGHSGAGKTTLIKMILAEERPSDGQIFFQSVDIHALKPKHMNQIRRRIGAIFQDFRLLPNLSAFENIAFAMEASGRTDDEILADVPHILDLVGLSHKANNFPHELSGGEKQRVAIARAIVNQPDVILADEPTGNLDPINTREIVQILRKINDLGTTVILTTHNKGVIDSLGKRVITLGEGRVLRDDPTGKYILEG